MKNLLETKSHAAEMPSNRQLTTHNMAVLAKVDATKYGVAKCEMAEFDNVAVDIDEMQIDKLYQSL